MNDLFAAIAPKPDEVDQSRIPKFRKLGRAMIFDHPCRRCGDPDAAFGEHVNILAAIRNKDVSLAGTWLCGPCWRQKREQDGRD